MGHWHLLLLDFLIIFIYFHEAVQPFREQPHLLSINWSKAALPPTNVVEQMCWSKISICMPSSEEGVGIYGWVGVCVQPSPYFGHQWGGNSLMKCGTGPWNAISGFHICRKDETRFLILQWWCQWEYMTARIIVPSLPTHVSSCSFFHSFLLNFSI